MKDFKIIVCNIKKAFTMAEILISLTIIGIIAAITLPALQSNINEKVWNTQRKALHTRFTQALLQMPALNGYGEYSGTWEDDVVTVDNDTAAMSFITEGLSKVLKLENICDKEHISDCGISSQITTMSNNKVNFPTKLSELNPIFVQTYTEGNGYSYTNPLKHVDTEVAAFETKNGESVALFYNPLCLGKDMGIQRYAGSSIPADRYFYFPQPYMCADFIYDLNGRKGPNTVGKDIGFIVAMYPTDSMVVAPMPLNKTYSSGSYYQATSECRKYDEDSRLPNKEELSGIYYNLPFIKDIGGWYWTSTSYNGTRAWIHSMGAGYVSNRWSKEDIFQVLCIKR